jgi:peptidoglycan/xylan/chitin deacetylase (PgdA/CDA1 family)
VRRLLIAIVVLVVLAYGGYRLYRRTNAIVPAIVTPTMDAGRVVSTTLRARWDRLVHGSTPPQGERPRLIALTFDDGPYPVETPLLLDELDDLHVRATFFLIGRDGQQYPELVRRIAAHGDEIADHTLTHPNLDGLDAAATKREIDEGARVLAAIVPDPALRTLMRPPHGRYTLETLHTAQADGYDVVLWNDDPGDWRAVSADVIAAHLFRFATAPEIVLLHSGRRATIDMLPRVVARFRAEGYTFVTVGELLRRVSVDQLNHPAKHVFPG